MGRFGLLLGRFGLLASGFFSPAAGPASACWRATSSACRWASAALLLGVEPGLAGANIDSHRIGITETVGITHRFNVT
ncbi:MAG: hypothetical protein U0401_27570 [Anaerolineae bacterium]